MIFTVEENFSPRRLDVYISEKISDSSRSHVQKLIADGLVTFESERLANDFYR